MQSIDPRLSHDPRADASAADLVREAMGEAKRLIELEVELAKDEVRHELVAVRTGAIALAASALVAVLALALLLVALALAIFPGPVPALIMGLVLLAASVLAGIMGMRLLPTKPMSATRRRIEADVEVVKDEIAKAHVKEMAGP